MVRINPDESVCTVVVTVDADPSMLPTVVEHARLGVEEHFPRYDGFVGGALHVSGDGGRLVQYLQWASEEHYRRCRDDARWDDLPSTARFMALVGSGQATVDARTYTVVARSPSGRES